MEHVQNQWNSFMNFYKYSWILPYGQC